MFSRLAMYRPSFAKNARRVLLSLNSTSRGFASKNIKDAEKVQAQSTPKDKKTVPIEKQEQKESNKEESKNQEQNEEYDEYEHYEHTEQSSRFRLLTAIGKAIKYSIWTYMALFSYHFYLVKKRERPEEAFG